MTWSCDDSVSGTLGRHMLLWLSFQGSYFALSSIIEAWFIVYLFNMRIPVPVFILTLADCYRKFLYPLPQSTTSSISHPSQWHAESYTDRDLLRSYFRKHRKDLRLAQPPKRLFAGVQSWAHGGEDDLDPGGVHWDLVDSCWLCLVRNSTNDGDVVAQHAKCTDTMWYLYYPLGRCSFGKVVWPSQFSCIFVKRVAWGPMKQASIKAFLTALSASACTS